MSKKLLLLLFLVIILVLTAFSNDKEDNEPITFSVLFNEVQGNPFSEDWAILKEYLEKKNVILDVRLGDNANYEEAIKLNMNAETPPDVILKVWPDTIEGYASEGLLLPISDYEYLMPNYQKYIKEHNLENEIDKLRLENGKYYILPGYQRAIQVQQWIYRQDLFEKHNIPTPTTYDELYESLVLLKELYPDSTPITASWGGAHLLCMMGAGYGIPDGWCGTRYYNESEDKWQYAPATTNYREMYRFLNKCYEAGIFDPAIFSQGNEEFTEKLLNGKGIVTVTWISSGFNYWNQLLEKNGITGGKWVPLPVMESTIGISKLPSVVRFRKGIAITADAINKPYFENMMQFLDWAIYSDEGMDLTYWGVEGLTYENTSDGKELLPVDLGKYGFISFFDLCENESFENYKKPDEIVAFLERSVNANETLNPSPELILNNYSIEMTEIIDSNLTPYVNKTGPKFITGELSIDDDWDSYLAELEDLGYKTLEAIWNASWNNQN